MAETTGQVRRPPGRPRDPRKRDAILDAARALFFARGIEAVTMEAVASASGVSKMTLYGLFPDKATLFEEVARAQAGRLLGVLGAAFPQESRADPAPPLLREALARFGAALLGFWNSAEVRAFIAIMATEAQRFPDLARRFYQAGPERGRHALAAVVRDAAARGEIQLGGVEPEQVAEDFIGLLQGLAPLRQHLGMWPVMEAGALEAQARHAADVLVRAYCA